MKESESPKSEGVVSSVIGHLLRWARRESHIPNTNQIQGIFEGFIQGKGEKDVRYSYVKVGAIDNHSGNPILFHVRIAPRDETRIGRTGWRSGEVVTIHASKIFKNYIGLDESGRKTFELDQMAQIRILNDEQRNKKK